MGDDGKHNPDKGIETDDSIACDMHLDAINALYGQAKEELNQHGTSDTLLSFAADLEDEARQMAKILEKQRGAERKPSYSRNPFDDMRLKLQKCRGRDDMKIEDNNEQSLNPFIAKHQQREAKVAQSGLGDILDLMAVESEVEKRICSDGITDEVEKRKVFEEVKQQQLEYKEHIRQSISKPISAVTDVEDTTEQPIEEDAESEFRRGYEHCIQYEKRQEERNQRPYLKGWHAAYQEILHNKALAMEAEEEQSETSFISVTVENSAITQLREEIKQLDERLRKLERYTEE